MNKKLFEALSKQFKDGAPKIWGTFHIVSVVIAILMAIVIIAALWKSTKKEVATFWILLTFWIVLMAIEILKQFYAGSNIDPKTGKWYWKYEARWAFPFVLCSMPLYFIPLYLATYKTKWFKTVVLDFIGIYCLYGGAFVMILYPGDVFIPNIFISTHTMIFHGLMLVMGMFLVITNIVKLGWKAIGHAFAIFMVLWAIVGIGNEIIWQLHIAKKISFMPNLLNISHRLENSFAVAIGQLTNGKVKITSLTLYLVYPVWTFIVSTIIYGIFAFIGWSTRKIEFATQKQHEKKLLSNAQKRRMQNKQPISPTNN